ncbi:hypothetical protein V8F20_002467 [Naviculisporaceae sp. PSN 640]
MYKQYLVLPFAGFLLQSLGVLARQERPSSLLTRREDGKVVDPNAYPFCNPKKDESCITEGKYLLPTLPIQYPGDKGETAYKKYLPTHDAELSKWTNGMMPKICHKLGVEMDKWDVADFEMYNVTFADCKKSPFVMCYHTKAQKTPEQIATEISRVPAGMRQSTSTFMVYSDEESDNPKYKGFIAAACPQGIVAGVSEAYFITPLLHEIGHAIDCTLASPDSFPGGFGTEFSNTSNWIDAVDEDGVSVSQYGTTSYTENFAEAGRLVVMDNIFPGGLKAFAGNHPNITQLKNQLDAVKKSPAGKYYKEGGECDLDIKFPFPTDLVDVKRLIKEEGNGNPEESEPSKPAESDDAPATTSAQVAPGPSPTTAATDGAAKPDTKDSGARRLRPFFFM